MSENNETFQERMYQRAINVYEYQGNKNSTWMHLYAIFTGAFFVAFYNLKLKGDEFNIYIFLILIMGLLTSICWLGTYHAYHSWLKNYVKTMHFREDKLLNERYESKGWDEANKEIRMEYINHLRLHTLGFSKDLKDGFFGGLSGEKINKLFICFVVLGWMFSLLLYAFKAGFEYFIFTTMFVVVLLFFLIIIFVIFMKSNGIKNMWMVNEKGELIPPASWKGNS